MKKKRGVLLQKQKGQARLKQTPRIRRVAQKCYETVASSRSSKWDWGVYKISEGVLGEGNQATKEHLHWNEKEPAALP